VTAGFHFNQSIHHGGYKGIQLPFACGNSRSIVVLHLILNGIICGYDLVPFLSENPQGFEVQCLDGFLVQMRRGAVLSTATVGPGSSGSSGGAISEPINGAIRLTASEKRILEAIKQNPRITRKELIELLGVGESTVFRATKKPKTEGIIERIGSNKGGYWRVAD